MTSGRSSSRSACCSRAHGMTVIGALTPAEAAVGGQGALRGRRAGRPELREGPHERRAGPRARRRAPAPVADAPGHRHDRVELDRPRARSHAARRARLHREAVGRTASGRVAPLPGRARPRTPSRLRARKRSARSASRLDRRGPSAPIRSGRCACSRSRGCSSGARWNATRATSAARPARSGSAGRRCIAGWTDTRSKAGIEGERDTPRTRRTRRARSARVMRFNPYDQCSPVFSVVLRAPRVLQRSSSARLVTA